MEKYKILTILGNGTYGIVYQAINIQTKQIVAIKTIKNKFSSWEECLNLREIQVLKRLNHPNLVKLIDVIKDNNHELHLVFEFIEQNLLQYYQQIMLNNQSIPESNIRSIIFQLAQGLCSMHKQALFHRDLKPENILISPHEKIVKICDFGLTKSFLDNPPYSDYIATRWYRAPELLLKSNSYGPEIDIFALGCIMAELYIFRPLFDGSTEIDHLHKICKVLGTPNEAIWPEGIKLANAIGFQFTAGFTEIDLKYIITNASKDAIDLIKQMLKWNPNQRINAKGILMHPYLMTISTISKSLTMTNLSKMISFDMKNITNNSNNNYHHQHQHSNNENHKENVLYSKTNEKNNQYPYQKQHSPVATTKYHQYKNEKFEYRSILDDLDVNFNDVKKIQTLKNNRTIGLFHTLSIEKIPQQLGDNTKDIKELINNSKRSEKSPLSSINNSPISKSDMASKFTLNTRKARFASMLNTPKLDSENNSINGVDSTVGRHKSTDHDDYQFITYDVTMKKARQVSPPTSTNTSHAQYDHQESINRKLNSLKSSLSTFHTDKESFQLMSLQSTRSQETFSGLLGINNEKTAKSISPSKPETQKNSGLQVKSNGPLSPEWNSRSQKNLKTSKLSIESKEINFLNMKCTSSKNTPKALSKTDKNLDNVNTGKIDVLEDLKLKMKELSLKSKQIENLNKQNFPSLLMPSTIRNLNDNEIIMTNSVFSLKSPTHGKK